VQGSEYLKKYDDVDWIEGIQPYQFEKNDVDLRNILSETVIPSPIYERHRQEIENAAENASDMTQNYIERLKEKEKIMQYTLSVPYWYWTKYQSAVRQGKACSFAPVKLSKREQIPVMECEYDEAGFHQMNFQDQTGMGIIL
jgi:CRISPR-associated endonuclease/helicase Cas3